MVEAVGPIYTGGFESISAGDGGRFAILYLPDKHNDELQREGKAPVYYWMPNYVRLARNGDTGDYKFHLIHFVGVQNEETHVGVEGTREVAGGVLSLTTTSSFPTSVLQNAQNELLERFRGKDLKYWGWRSPAAPMFRPMPIMSNTTTITNLSPLSDGSVPIAALGGAGGASGGPTAPSGGNGEPVVPVPMGPPGNGSRSLLGLEPRFAEKSLTVPYGRDFRAPSNLDAWYFRLQGQGPGSITPTGENAFSGLVGSLPAAILWQGFHGTYSPIVVAQALSLKVWSQTLRIVIHGNWDRIFTHFSTAAKGRAWWFSGDIKAEFNNLRINGDITVQLEIDGTLPSADKLREEASKRIDQITAKFMEEAQKRIFEPAPPTVEPAQATAGGGGLFGFLSPYNAGFALKYRRDSTRLELRYDETRSEQYLQSHVISSSLEGFYDEIKRDQANEKKYFTTLYLDDWDRKVSRIVKPVVNWSDASKKWVGEPVAFMSVQVGYPSARGDIQWASHVFQSTDTGDTTRWQVAMTKKNMSDIANPPQGWQPDQTFVKRKVHLLEPPGESDYPFMRVFVEESVVDLDPGPTGTLTNENTLEVRADSVGKLEVGPISLNVDLETSKQTIEVEFQALGKTKAGRDRSVTRFTWHFEDQFEPRYWEIFTGQLDYIPVYRYRVHVLVKGSIFTRGVEWWGPWVEVGGNGPLMVTVPTQDDEGVVSRRMVPEIRSEEPIVLPPPLPEFIGVGIGAPPMAAGTAVGVRTVPTTKKKANGDGNVSGYELAPPETALSSAQKSGRRKKEKLLSEAISSNGEEITLPEAEGWTTANPDIET